MLKIKAFHVSLFRTNCFTRKRCAMNWRQWHRTCAVTSCGGDYENHLGKRAGISPNKHERNFSPFTETAHLAGTYILVLTRGRAGPGSYK